MGEVARVSLASSALPEADAFVDGPFGSNLKTDEYVDAGVRLVQLQNVGDGYWNDGSKHYITPTKFRELVRHGGKPGDIVIAKMADPVARACLLPDIDSQYVVVADVIRLRPDPERFDARYVTFAINSPDTRKEAEQRATGSTRLRINLSELKRVSIWSPPLVEQRRIARILDTMDEAIQSTEHLVKKLGLTLRGLLDSLIPFDSERKNVRNLRDVSLGTGQYGCVAAAVPRRDGWPRYVRITDITDQGALRSDAFASVAPETARGAIIGTGDLLFARSGATVGKTYLYEPRDGLCAFAGYLIRFQPDQSKVMPEYLRWWTRSARYWSWVGRTLRQGAQPNINAREYGAADLPIPSLARQREICATLGAVDCRLTAEHQLLDSQVQLRAGVAADLLCGRVRTVVA